MTSFPNNLKALQIVGVIATHWRVLIPFSTIIIYPNFLIEKARTIWCNPPPAVIGTFASISLLIVYIKPTRFIFPPEPAEKQTSRKKVWFEIEFKEFFETKGMRAKITVFWFTMDINIRADTVKTIGDPHIDSHSQNSNSSIRQTNKKQKQHIWNQVSIQWSHVHYPFFLFWGVELIFWIILFIYISNALCLSTVITTNILHCNKMKCNYIREIVSNLILGLIILP